MIFVKCFVIGGLICSLVQLIIDRTKVTPGRVMVGLVVSGVVISAVGIYKPFAEFAGCGATVPLIGFGHNLWQGMVEAIDEEGILGLFRGGFSASAVGLSTALIFGYLAALLFKPKI